MKFIAPLDDQTQDRLRLLMRQSPNARVRHRAHAVLLSSKRYPMEEIADIFEVDRSRGQPLARQLERAGVRRPLGWTPLR